MARSARLLWLIAALAITPPGHDAAHTAPLVLLALALALADTSPHLPERVRGIATGAAAVLDPAALGAVALTWVAGRRRAATLATSVTATGLCASLWTGGLPGSGWQHLYGASTDSSLRAALALIGVGGTAGAVPLLMLSVALLLTALPRAVRLLDSGQGFAAVAVASCAVAAALPHTRPAELVWLLAAAVFARAGNRPEDRIAWPLLAVAATTLTTTTLDPHTHAALSLLIGMTGCLALVACAAVVRFRVPTDPTWVVRRAPGPSGSARIGPVLPARLRPVSRPNLILELVGLRVGYRIYELFRGRLTRSLPDQRHTALTNAKNMLGAERFLHIDFEHALNHWALSVPWLFRWMQTYYDDAHHAIPLLFLMWLYIWHPTRYRTARTGLAVATVFALVGFTLFPLAPPRLVPGAGMHDLLPGQRIVIGHPIARNLVNSYAAMPSLHMTWALWCVAVVWWTIPRWWVRALVCVYPVVTFFVVVGTANHWVLDAVGGDVMVVVGMLVQTSLTGRTLRDDLPADLARLSTAPTGPASKRAIALPPAVSRETSVSAQRNRTVEEPTPEALQEDPDLAAGRTRG